MSVVIPAEAFAWQHVSQVTPGNLWHWNNVWFLIVAPLERDDASIGAFGVALTGGERVGDHRTFPPASDIHYGVSLLNPYTWRPFIGAAPKHGEIDPELEEVDQGTALFWGDGGLT